MANGAWSADHGHRRVGGGCALLVVVTCAGAWAQTRGASPSVPDDATLEAAGAVIGDITIHAGEIFDTEDPKEDKKLLRAANRLHRTTRDHVIRRQLTFATGDRYSRALLDESERQLRHNGYLYDAEIRPLSYDGKTVEIGVWTRDVWTLRPAVGFRRSGGVNVFHFGLRDANFLGLGKDVQLERVNGIDRTQTIVSYDDPALLGSHTRLSLGYSNNTDGRSALFGVERPFWRRDELWGGGVRGQTDDRTDSLYSLGEITSQFQEQLTYATAWFGKRVRTSAVTTKRLLVGYTYERSDFAAPGPPDRVLAYPWIGVSLFQDGYVQAHDMDKLGRTEDVNLGLDLLARFGWATPVVGADRNAAMIDFSIQNGFSPGRGQIVKLDVAAKGRIAGDGDFQDCRLDVSSRYYHRDSEVRLFFMSLSGSAAANLDPDHQLLLGGDNGLRGYPLRYALGDKSILLTVEERFFINRELFHLVRIGGAVFADIGKAWSEMPDAAAHLGVLKDVGFGLRIGQTRSAQAAVLRIDVAVPFDIPGGGFHPQLLVSTGETF